MESKEEDFRQFVQHLELCTKIVDHLISQHELELAAELYSSQKKIIELYLKELEREDLAKNINWKKLDNKLVGLVFWTSIYSLVEPDSDMALQLLHSLSEQLTKLQAVIEFAKILINRG